MPQLTWDQRIVLVVIYSVKSVFLSPVFVDPETRSTLCVPVGWIEKHYLSDCFCRVFKFYVNVNIQTLVEFAAYSCVVIVGASCRFSRTVKYV